MVKNVPDPINGRNCDTVNMQWVRLSKQKELKRFTDIIRLHIFLHSYRRLLYKHEAVNDSKSQVQFVNWRNNCISQSFLFSAYLLLLSIDKYMNTIKLNFPDINKKKDLKAIGLIWYC